MQPSTSLSTVPELSNRIKMMRVTAAILAAIGAAFASGAPTEISWWDLVLRCTLAFLFTFIGSRAHPLALAAAGAVGAFLALPSPWLVAGAAALFIALQYLMAAEKDPVAQQRPDRIQIALSAVAAGLAIQSLLRLQDRFFFGANTLAVAAVVVAVCASAWFRASPGGRWISLRAGAAVTALVLLVALGALATIPGGRDAAADGVFATERGLQAASDGDTDVAKRYLDLADQSFSKANNRFGAIWAQPARLMPVLSQHLRALDVASANGSALTSVALDVTESIDVSTMVRPDGGMDIAQLQGARPRLDDAVELLATARAELADVKSPWLAPALATRIDRASEDMIEASSDAELAASAATSAPLILGSDIAQHYLVLFGSPSQARELGGILSNWTLIRMENGKIDRINSGRGQDLGFEAERGDGLSDPNGYPQYYTNLDPVGNPRNITALPSIVDVGRAAADIFPTLFDETLDGVIYIDPEGLASLLTVVGPISPEGTDLQLDASNLVEYIQMGQYEAYPDSSERSRILDNLISQVLSSLGSVQLPGPNRLANIFGPAGRGRHLQMVTFNEETNDFLRSVDLLQDFKRVNGQDFLSVTTTNLAVNKLDAWIDRSISYELDIDAVSGELASTVIVEITSRATPGLSTSIRGAESATLAPGQHHTELTLWTPHELVAASVSGQTVDVGATNGYGLNRYSVPIIIDPQGIRTVQFSLVGRVDSAAAYELHIASYPGATVDQLQLDLVRSDGTEEVTSLTLSEDLVVSLPVIETVTPR